MVPLGVDARCRVCDIALAVWSRSLMVRLWGSRFEAMLAANIRRKRIYRSAGFLRPNEV